jgi:anti-sigma regulatory factor (Ser/Thr protein kinase)
VVDRPAVTEQIIVSELVTNAVEHARPILELVVRLRDRVQIEVADGSPDPPVPADPRRRHRADLPAATA